MLTQSAIEKSDILVPCTYEKVGDKYYALSGSRPEYTNSKKFNTREHPWHSPTKDYVDQCSLAEGIVLLIDGTDTRVKHVYDVTLQVPEVGKRALDKQGRSYDLGMECGPGIYDFVPSFEGFIPTRTRPDKRTPDSTQVVQSAASHPVFGDLVKHIPYANQSTMSQMVVIDRPVSETYRTQLYLNPVLSSNNLIHRPIPGSEMTRAGYLRWFMKTFGSINVDSVNTVVEYGYTFRGMMMRRVYEPKSSMVVRVIGKLLVYTSRPTARTAKIFRLSLKDAMILVPRKYLYIFRRQYGELIRYLICVQWRKDEVKDKRSEHYKMIPW